MGYPPPQGLYDPRNERDACGVGFVAHIKGAKSHAIVSQALEILANLDHRGAVGADPLLGDGAGILLQIPDPLFRKWAAAEGKDLPQPGDYAVAMCFLPQHEQARELIVGQFEKFIAKEGQILVGWRDVPTDSTGLGKAVIESMPMIRQCVVARGPNTPDQDAFERKLITIRKQTQNPLDALAQKHAMPEIAQLYMPSFSSRLICSATALHTDRSPECSRATSLPAACAAAYSASISSSDIGAVSTMRALSGQYCSSSADMIEPA